MWWGCCREGVAPQRGGKPHETVTKLRNFGEGVFRPFGAEGQVKYYWWRGRAGGWLGAWVQGLGCVGGRRVDRWVGAGLIG